MGLVSGLTQPRAYTSVSALASASRNSSSNSALTINLGLYRLATFILDVTVASGTNPTLDIFLEYQDPASSAWIVQDTFARVTAADRQDRSIEVKGVDYRIRWVIGGTDSPAFTFSMGLLAER